MNGPEMARLKGELNCMKEKLDEGLAERATLIWLFSIVSRVVDYLATLENKTGAS